MYRQASSLYAFRFHWQYHVVFQLRGQLPTGAAFEPGPQQCAESGLDMILVDVPLLSLLSATYGAEQ